MQPKIFTARYTIKEGHLDSFGHMNNAKYLSLLEEARWDVLNRQGFGNKTMHQLQVGPTILEIHLRFLKELRLRDEVDIETKLLSYEGKIGKLQQRILIQNVEYCVAEFAIGLFDLNTRKLILPTKEWLAAIGA